MGDMSRENDIVIKQGEYCYLLDESKGIVQTIVGSCKISLSQTDSLVEFNENTKRFEKVGRDRAIKPFVVAPETYYIVLCNPVSGNINEHPKVGVGNISPELQVGRKINIRGGTKDSYFALFPGQMAKVIRGHRLCSNQYLLCKTYQETDKYPVGKMLIIKGTDTPFYIPPTGYEVIPLPNGEYVRNAVTLENLQYCILKNEGGEKKYVRGPAVVFPEPDEVFVTNEKNGSFKFDAIELSEISGIYVKVTSDYYDEEVLDHYEKVENEEGEEEEVPVYTEKVFHPAGEELFITGKDQAIYFPRREHEIISYEGKQVHHAIAIPEGEGRYVLNRLTGEITLVCGSRMFLPDPRYQVIVKRTLTKSQCEMWYPNNSDVLEYNGYGGTSRGLTSLDSLDNSYTLCCNTVSNQGIGNLGSSTKMGINRSNTYTPPRTISLDTSKFAGAVAVNVWAGYAVSVINKSGQRRIVTGPQNVLLEYDETLEPINNEVYIRLKDKYNIMKAVKTNDDVAFTVNLTFSYTLDANNLPECLLYNDYKEATAEIIFNALSEECKEISTDEFVDTYIDIVKKTIDKCNESGKLLLHIDEFTVSKAACDKNIQDALIQRRNSILSQQLAIGKMISEGVLDEERAKLEHDRLELEHQQQAFRQELEKQAELRSIKDAEEIRLAREAEDKAQLEAEKLRQTLLSANEKIKLQREKDVASQAVAIAKDQAKLETDKLNAETDAKKKLIDSITPDLIAAITTASNTETLRCVAENIAPWALASKDESVADVVTKLTRGTSLEGLLDKIVPLAKEQ